MNNKPRVVFPITLQFGIRYLLRSGLLHQLRDSLTPIILLAWHDQELETEFVSLGAEVHTLPKQVWGTQYSRYRKKLDDWHLTRVHSPSTKIDDKRNTIDLPFHIIVKNKIKRALNQLESCLPYARDHFFRQEEKLLITETNYQEFYSLVQSLKADAVFSLTPFHRDEEMLLRAAHKLGMPLCTAIHSFDNLTTRGWIPSIFHTYLLWNEYNAAELVRIYPETKKCRRLIVGTPQFDFYWDPSYRWDEGRWRDELGLPANRPVILFGGGPATIAPHEPHFLKQIDDAIENGKIQGNPIVLFRRHPVDHIERWQPVLSDSRHIICDNPWQPSESTMHFNVKRGDIERLVSTLLHCWVHVSTSSTLTVDGSIFSRPQVSPAYDDRPGRKYDRITRELYLREHYLPITNSGGVTVAYSRDELISAINLGIMNPEIQREGRQRIVRKICTFSDGRSTMRVAKALMDFLDETQTDR